MLMRLLRHFYADVRQHGLIGPVFEQNIDDWPAHLEKIGDFWSGLTGGPAHYRGAMPHKHLPLRLNQEHFEAWLGLWYRNCRTHLPPTEAEEMIGLANAIGRRLHQITAYHASTLDGGEKPE